MLVLVIVAHSMTFYAGDWFTAITPREPAPILVFAASYLASFVIFVFTFISGYLFQYLKFERGKYAGFAGFIKKR